MPTNILQLELSPVWASESIQPSARIPRPGCGILLTMNVAKMVDELRRERAQIEEAIMSLERLTRGKGKRRGRPPAWMTGQLNATKRRGRPLGSKNKRKAAAAA